MRSLKQTGALFLGLVILMASAPHRTPAAEVAPLVDQGWLLGGFSQGKWLSPSDTAKALKGGEPYRLCTLTRFLGQSRGAKPKPNPLIEVGPEFSITFTPAPETREPVVAVGGTWPAMPRQPRRVENNLEPYADAAREILRSKGIADPKVNLTQVIEIDLDGDGVKEVLVSATRFTMAHLSDLLKDGDYSMVFLWKPVKGAVRHILIAGQFKSPTQPEPGLATTLRLVGLVDANGDGVMEIVVNYKYYEGGGMRVYQLKGDSVDEVLAEDWGA
jgi:hypothetical protein